MQIVSTNELKARLAGNFWWKVNESSLESPGAQVQAQLQLPSYQNGHQVALSSAEKVVLWLVFGPVPSARPSTAVFAKAPARPDPAFFEAGPKNHEIVKHSVSTTF